MSGSTWALLVTLAIEVPITGLFYRRRLRTALGLAFVANAITNTLLNRFWLAIVPWPAVALVTGEALSFAAEAWAYARIGSRERAILASATANLASFVVGPLLLGYWKG